MISLQKNNANRFFALLTGMFLLCVFVASYSEQYLIMIIPFAGLFFYYSWQTLKPAFFLLLFSLPWSIEYTFNQTLGTDLPDEPLMLLVALLVVAHWTYQPLLISKQTFQHPLLVCLVIHITWMAISVLFSSDLLVSVKFFLAKSWYLGAFVAGGIIVFRTKGAIRFGAIIFIVSMFCISMVALIRHSMADFAFVNINDSIAPFFVIMLIILPCWFACCPF